MEEKSQVRKSEHRIRKDLIAASTTIKIRWGGRDAMHCYFRIADAKCVCVCKPSCASEREKIAQGTQKQTVKRAGRLAHECHLRAKLRLATQKCLGQRKDESPTRFQVTELDSQHYNVLVQCQIRHLMTLNCTF